MHVDDPLTKNARADLPVPLRVVRTACRIGFLWLRQRASEIDFEEQRKIVFVCFFVSARPFLV